MDKTEIQQKKKSQKFLDMMDSVIAEEDLKEVIDYIFEVMNTLKGQMEEKMKQDKGEMASMHSQMYAEVEEMESEIKDKLVKLEGKFGIQLDNITKQIDTKINEIRDMIPTIPSLEPLEARIEEVEAKIPKIPDEITSYQVRDKLEAIDNESEKLKIEAIQKLREELDRIWEELSKKGGKSLFGGGFNYSAMDLHLKDDVTPTGDINDVNTVFSLPSTPSPASSLKVYLNGARQRLTVDYTLSGATITFTTAPQTDSVLLCDYRI